MSFKNPDKLKKKKNIIRKPESKAKPGTENPYVKKTTVKKPKAKKSVRQ